MFTLYTHKTYTVYLPCQKDPRCINNKYVIFKTKTSFTYFGYRLNHFKNRSWFSRKIHQRHDRENCFPGNFIIQTSPSAVVRTSTSYPLGIPEIGCGCFVFKKNLLRIVDIAKKNGRKV